MSRQVIFSTLLGVIVLAVMVVLAYGLVATPDNLIALAKQAGGGH